MTSSQPQRSAQKANYHPSRFAGRGELLQYVRDKLHNARGQGDGFTACCPAHDDCRASLSVSMGNDGRVLLHCFAGCTPESIVGALGMTMAELFPGHQRNRRVVHLVQPRRTRAVPEPETKWLSIATEAYGAGLRRLGWLADTLGVAYEALLDLRVGWLNAAQIARLGGKPAEAYTIPERDGRNRVVGVALRRPDGSKTYLPGGRRGLVIPASIRQTMPEHLYAVEGMSDCAALLTAGKPAVARASCTSGARELYDLLKDRPNTAVTIIGDRDRPGRNGGISVQCELQVLLKRPVGFALPPKGFKDMRAALIGGAL